MTLYDDWKLATPPEYEAEPCSCDAEAGECCPLCCPGAAHHYTKPVPFRGEPEPEDDDIDF